MTIRQGRRGFALMLVMLEMALIAALWGVAHRQLVSTMRFLTAMNQPGQAVSTQDVDGYKPLAMALSLLETGDPTYQGQAVDAFTCNVTILTSSGPAYFLVTYQKQPAGSVPDGSANESWMVSSTQQSVAASDLPSWNANMMPSTFGD